MLSVWIPFCSLKISQKWMQLVDSIECRTTLGIYVHSPTVAYWCLFPIGSMYIYIYLPTFTIIYYKNQPFTYQSHAKDSGFVTFFPPKKKHRWNNPSFPWKQNHSSDSPSDVHPPKPTSTGGCKGVKVLAICFSSWWFQPVWKICGSQIGSFPQIGVKLKNIWHHHHPGLLWNDFGLLLVWLHELYTLQGTITYPTWGKGKSSTQQCLVGGIC